MACHRMEFVRPATKLQRRMLMRASAQRRTLHPRLCTSLSRWFLLPNAVKIGPPSERQILMDERDRHAAFAHTAGHAFDRTVTNVASAKYTRKACLQRKRLSIKRPRGQVSSGVNIAFGITLQGRWKPGCVRGRADHQQQCIGTSRSGDSFTSAGYDPLEPLSTKHFCDFCP